MRNGRNWLNPLGFLVLFVFCFSCEEQQTDPLKIPLSEKRSAEDSTEVFDSTFAARLGADEYGMKKYVMAFLKKGPNRNRSEEETEELQRAHLDNIISLSEEGVLVLAGPFMDEGEIRGIYIFDVSTVEEAELLVNSDPAIEAGSLVMELHPWYGSAALMEVNEIHKQIAKIRI